MFESAQVHAGAVIGDRSVVFSTLREAAANALEDAEKIVLDQAQGAVRPIYRNKGLRPEHVGSCTFIELDGQDYLLTAAHVIDGHQHHTLFVGHKGLLPVTLTFLSTIPPRGDRNRDRIDFAFAKVNDSWRERGINPLSLSGLVTREDAPFYTAIGYPNSRNRKYNPVKLTIRPTIRQFVSVPTNENVNFAALGLSRNLHLALSRPNKAFNSQGGRVQLFEPRGMSGGPIFGLYGLHRPLVMAGQSAPLIVPQAIVTERSQKFQILFGTRLEVIVDTIRRYLSR